jgi:ferritin-like metal-binding protein YciE
MASLNKKGLYLHLEVLTVPACERDRNTVTYKGLEAKMRLPFARIDNLRKLYVDQIQHLHSAETQITEALAAVIETASNPELKRVLQTHLQESREHVSGLQNILDTAGKPESKRSKAMAALIAEANDLIADTKNERVRDAGIITAYRRIEHYEIAAYEAVRDFAKIIDESDQAALHQRTLEEERKADEALMGLADSANTMADRAA